MRKFEGGVRAKALGFIDPEEPEEEEVVAEAETETEVEV